MNCFSFSEMKFVVDWRMSFVNLDLDQWLLNHTLENASMIACCQNWELVKRWLKWVLILTLIWWVEFVIILDLVLYHTFKRQFKHSESNGENDVFISELFNVFRSMIDVSFQVYDLLSLIWSHSVLSNHFIIISPWWSWSDNIHNSSVIPSFSNQNQDEYHFNRLTVLSIFLLLLLNIWICSMGKWFETV